MKIGILGSGIVGKVLARAFASEGHTVTLGTRNPGKPELDAFKAENPGIPVASFADMAAGAELIVIAVSGDIAVEAVQLAGLANFEGKTVIDATNPIAKTAPVNGVLNFFTAPNYSLMEELQKTLPAAKLVKAFSCVGNAHMYKPDFGGQQPTMFICGNDEGAKQTVTDILSSFGWEVEDMGMAESARAIEPLCILWCLPGFRENRWNHAFKLLKK
ncbi:MAG: NAD(P)-binding domain-containing protein [Ferruginibacter sp.]